MSMASPCPLLGLTPTNPMFSPVYQGSVGALALLKQTARYRKHRLLALGRLYVLPHNADCAGGQHHPESALEEACSRDLVPLLLEARDLGVPAGTNEGVLLLS